MFGRLHKPLSAVMVIASLGAIASGFATSRVDAQGAPGDNDTLKIGIVAPMSGANSRYGAFALKGAQLAANEINAAGGVLGRKIEIVSGDSQCAPAEGVSATQRLIRFDKVAMIIGDVCSSVTLAMQPVVESTQTILMNAASSNPEITYRAGVGGYKWTFRNYPTDELRAAIALQYASQKKHYEKYAVLSVDSDYGRGAIAFTKKYLSRYNASILSEDYYKETETDFRPVLTKIKYSGAQAIIMYGQADTAPIVARQMLEMGLAGKVHLVGNAEFANPKTIAAAPAVLNGAVEVAAWLPEWQSPRSLAFVKDYQIAYDGEMPSIQAYSPWESLHLLARAVQEAGSLNNEAVRQAIAKIKYKSVMGEVTFDDHQQAVLPMVLIEDENGKPVIKGAMYTKVDYPKK
ncbi:ABC transporter substrate-binding protein [Burkholderia multivorans]|uniref:ABC transporter substrate-binding protein n=1 Tax=Burkholderia multivorans TaxID=87883 RepID=UPI0021C0AF85|nr:ABC transporter substrate-binding protein [Burkholderia multivorans]MDR8763733.1 Leucine-, isoleucine-, valine-, threonine-, and alanine-binding protein [Burkholderia multivorans]MDR8766201.1 Leucine-, isoleucine-, valine-, threonine-, and alanine-binding protein [Burkholderia multivorans]MDR8770012.1 Leucine-, isoleucine-, valine-, threonine-, and alanine-binding protein [Burkholderia multivorans]MDR8789730.1 Leucine-, isoleucine-, valine-, threonine-, and alanine-binding protein [Burkholde